jgi:PAS domain S-box-containing protein
MLNLNVLLITKDIKESLEISNKLDIWNFKKPKIISSIDEAIQILTDFDVILIDINFKDEFELRKSENLDLELYLPVIFIRNHDTDKFSKDLFMEPFSFLFNTFNFDEFMSAVEIAIYKQNLIKNFKRSEKFSKDVLNAFYDSLFIIDRLGTILDVNEATAKRLGKTKEEIVGFNFKKFIPPKMIESRWENIEIAIDSGEGFEFEDEMDGTYFHHKIFPISEDNEVFQVIINSQDITESKNAEKALKQANLYNRSLIESSIDPLVTIGPDGKITDINDAVESVTGYSRQEIIGTDFSDYFTHPEDANKGYKEVFAFGFVKDYPLKIRHKNGHVTPVLYNASLYHNEEGEVMGVFAAARDITQIEAAEAALKDSERKFRTLIETAQEGVWVIDEEAKTTYVNDAMMDMLGYSLDEMIGKSLFDFMDDDAEIDAKEKMERRREGIKEKHDFRFLHKNGSNIWTIISTNPLLDKKGTFKGALGMLTDITQRKQMEEQLKSSLIEKEMYLKEIHHRVKNNLLVISSLLNLQSNYIKDKDDFDMFRESQTRAKSMALIHELLYQSYDLKNIDFGSYMTTLVNDLFNTYIGDQDRLKLNLNLQNPMIDINTSIPLGLIVNELVSNSLKHAFPGDMEGVINISLTSENGKIILIIADNGVGIGEDIDFKNTDSLGLQLVNNLTNQIEGELELDRRNGTEFKITFEKSWYEKSE